MKIKQLLILSIGILFVLIQTSCSSTKGSKTKSTILSGTIQNAKEDRFLFTYDTYALLEGTKRQSIEIDENGKFHFEIKAKGPISGTLDFGRDMIGGRGVNKYIYTYLEPGDSIYITADVNVLSDTNIIQKTLKYSGTAIPNNEFMHQTDLRFNSYQQLRENNSLFIMMQEPDQYKRTVDSIKDLKLEFVKAWEGKISPRLKQMWEDEAKNLAIVRKFNYPSQHKSFNKGKEAVLPPDYYAFADKVSIDDNLDNKGVPYLRFTHFYLSNKYQLAKQNGYDEDYLAFVNSELSGRQKYIYMAYSLTSDFNADVYYQFGKNCPYRDIAKIVETRFGHLEKMLPGKPSPEIILNTVKNENISSKNFFKNKLTYIDMWATWCKPCIKEFPDLAILKEEYKNENIQFVSISTDETRDAWINYVEKEGLSGAQFWADNNNKKIFNTAFNINMIPRFILLDGKGNIINANAPRPSSGQEIRKLLNNSLKSE